MFVHNFDGFYDKNKLDQVAFNCTLFEQNAKIMLYKIKTFKLFFRNFFQSWNSYIQ